MLDLTELGPLDNQHTYAMIGKTLEERRAIVQALHKEAKRRGIKIQTTQHPKQKMVSFRVV